MNFVFLVRSFVANLVFLVIFLSKYAGHFPEKFHFRFFNWGEIFFNECTGITFLLSSTEPVVYQVFGWKMGHILGVSLQKHGVFLKGNGVDRAGGGAGNNIYNMMERKSQYKRRSKGTFTIKWNSKPNIKENGKGNITGNRNWNRKAHRNESIEENRKRITIEKETEKKIQTGM